MAPKKSPARKRGRPIDPSVPRGRLYFRVHPEELAAWQAEADRVGLGLHTWIRATCNAASRGRA